MSAPAANHPLLLDTSAAEATANGTGALAADGTATASRSGGRFTSLQVAALALAGAGVVALAVGWFGVSDKVEVWEQIPYLVSGGLLGVVLVAFGITAWMANEHAEDRLRNAELAERIDRMETDLQRSLEARLDELEMAVAAELDELRGNLRLKAGQ